jgi:hypothetical protein
VRLSRPLYDYSDAKVQGSRLDELVGVGVQPGKDTSRIADMVAACKLVTDNEASPTQAALAVSQSPSTVKRWLRAMQSFGEAPRRGSPTLLFPREERHLVALTLTRQALNAPLTKHAVGRLAAHILQRRDWRFATANGEPGPDWWAGFLKRWPELSTRVSSRLSSESLLRPTHENLEPWFALVRELQATVPRCRWFNLDESQIRAAAEKVLVARGTKHVHAAKPGYKGHVTILPCVSADGKVLPTMFVFQGKHAKLDLLNGGPQDAAVAVTGVHSLLARIP